MLFRSALDISGLDFSNFEGDVIINCMKVQGDLYQSWQEIQGDYFCEGVEVKGDIFVSEPTKLLKGITTEELAELGYELKGGN